MAAQRFIDSVRENVGDEAADLLTREFAGATIFVPEPWYLRQCRRVHSPHRLESVLGYDAAVEVCRLHGGNRVYVPTDRMAAARSAVQDGQSAESLMSGFRVSARTVSRWIKRWGGDHHPNNHPHNDARPPGAS